MGTINLGPCGCCGEPEPCAGMCNATSVTMKLETNTTASFDPFRPCTKPCSVTYERTVGFGGELSGSLLRLYSYNAQWREWMPEVPDGGVDSASGSLECQTAQAYFGTLYGFDIPCNLSRQNAFRRLKFFMQTMDPDANAGSWLNGLWYSGTPQSYPGFPANACQNLDPICGYNKRKEPPGIDCRPEVWRPGHYGGAVFQGTDFGTPTGYLPDEFWQDDCDTFCGKTYTTDTQVFRVHSSTMSITFNCLP